MSVRYAILGLLAQKPRHGYELRSAFHAVVGGEETWNVKPAQVYATLSRLAEAGWVAEEGVEQGSGPEKRIYDITPQGRQALEQWFYSGVAPEHQRDEFFVKLMIALVTGDVQPRRVIQTQRVFLYRELHAVTVLRQSYNLRTQLAQVLMIDKAIMHLEADLRWLDMVEGRLEEIQRQPLPEPDIRPRGRPRKVEV
ncbi:MAG: PadR family transcriptional regulator [Chloroflexi bacterium]|nr:PadR family transcriptional regulator [Chloroflexota bacterium]